MEAFDTLSASLSAPRPQHLQTVRTNALAVAGHVVTGLALGLGFAVGMAVAKEGSGFLEPSLSAYALQLI